MKYTLEELREMILPMIQSLGNRPPEELADAIVEIIKQDREAGAAGALKKVIEDHPQIEEELKKAGFMIDKEAFNDAAR